MKKNKLFFPFSRSLGGDGLAGDLIPLLSFPHEQKDKVPPISVRFPFLPFRNACGDATVIGVRESSPFRITRDLLTGSGQTRGALPPFFPPSCTR